MIKVLKHKKIARDVKDREPMKYGNRAEKRKPEHDGQQDYLKESIHGLQHSTANWGICLTQLISGHGYFKYFLLFLY